MEHSESDEHEQTDIEPAVVRKLAQNEMFAKEMQRQGVECEALQIGTDPIESKPYYSYLFPFTSRLVSNKGLIKLNGRNVDSIQILQRN